MEQEYNSDRLLELVSAALDERLDESSQRELESLLLADEKALQEFTHFVQMHCDLGYHATSNTALQNVLESIQGNLAEGRGSAAELEALSDGEAIQLAIRTAPSADQPSVSLPAGVDDSKSKRFFRYPARITAAVLLLVGVVGIWSTTKDPSPSNPTPLVAFRPPQPVASICQLEGAKWAGETTYALGELLVEGQTLTLEEGLAYISFASGAELVMHSPSTLSLQSGDRATLTHGNVTVLAAEWASGFQVDTETLKVVDLGTKFWVSADESGSVEAHVVEGQVRVEPLTSKLAGRRSLLLSQGEGVRVEHQGDPLRRLVAQQVGFAAEFSDFRPYRPIPIHNTGVGLAWGDEDSRWRIVAGPSGGDYAGPQYAVVCQPDEEYLANVPDRSQWIAATENLRPGCTPNSTYTFETHFDLSGFDLSTVVIVGQLLADNGIKAVRINGEPIEFTPWVDNAPNQKFHKFRKVEIKQGLVSGRNKIEVDLWNGIYSSGGPSPNPMALRAEWEAYGRPIEIEEAI